ncbi:MAG TPA: protein-L-isoaspartate O-methyltransferase [Caulobacteraceae bacterium]|jgi:protein-L-isoaspartate(D-aspartate) O-methyltransferase|nr:protein-L-isoaspartate O-methyltransferase [Caulobacteraceae bacterium]
MTSQPLVLNRRNLMGASAAFAAAGLASCGPGPLTPITNSAASNAATNVAAGPALPAPPANWTREAFEAAMQASGRPAKITDAEFAAIQARKVTALKRIEDYLTQRLQSADPNVMAAFQAIPREYYHYDYANHVASPTVAYEDDPKPWALGFGSALSDYLGQAYMTQVCAPKPGDVTLEIGTGSGFQSSMLSRIVSRAYSIEIIQPLGAAVGKIFAPLGYTNITSRVGDGYFGWPEVKDGFDIIIFTCAAQYAPPEVLKQLKPGGRMLIPIGQPFKRGQVLYVYTKDANGKIHSRRDVGVFFIPMTGTMMNTPKPAGV